MYLIGIFLIPINVLDKIKHLGRILWIGVEESVLHGEKCKPFNDVMDQFLQNMLKDMYIPYVSFVEYLFYKGYKGL